MKILVQSPGSIGDRSQQVSTLSSRSQWSLVGLILVLCTQPSYRDAQAEGLELNPATSTKGLTCTDLPPIVIIETVEGPIDDHCETNTTLGAQAASVSTTFAPTITAFASVGCDCIQNFDPGLGENAVVDFELRVRETSPPGFSNNGVPVRFMASARSESTTTGVGGSAFVRARSSASVPPLQPDVLDVFATTFIFQPDWVPLAEVDVTETVNLLVGGINLISVAAGCGLRRDDAPNETVGCMSLSSLSFEFDQTAFDDQHGVNTFPIADHYAMDLSPGLVPEPASLASALAAVATLLALARARSWQQRTTQSG